MSVTILKAPLPVHLSRNAIDVRFNAPDKFITEGDTPTYIFSFTTYADANDDTFEFEYQKDGVTITKTLTFKDTPDPELLEVSKYPGSNPEAFVEAVADALQSDPDLAADFIISFSTSTLRISLTGLFQDDNAPSGTATGFNITEHTASAGAIAETQEAYRFSAWLYVGADNYAGESEMIRTKEIEVDPDDNGDVELNFKRYAMDLLYQHEPPANSNLAFEICRWINRPAYIVDGQKWGNPLERKKQGKTSTFRILKGGLEPRDFADNKASLETFINGRFLTIRNRRLVTEKQTDWLAWYSTEDLTNVEVWAQYFAVDGTSLTAMIFQDDAEANQTHQFKVSMNLFFPSVTPVIHRMTVWLRHGGEDLTDKVTFISEPEDYKDITFQFENTLGVVESWKMKGERSILHKIEKQLYRKDLPFNHVVSDTDLHSYNELNSMTMEVSTGAMSPSDARAFPDFLRSRHVWIQISLSTRIPVRIPEGEALAKTFNHKGSHAYQGTFTIELGVSKNVSSNLI